MNLELKEFEKEINKVNTNLLNFLSKKITKKGFDLYERYGKATTAAAFSITNKHVEKIPLLMKAYEKDEKNDVDFPAGFNNFAFQHIKKEHFKEITNYINLKYGVSLFRKVTNLILLRTLTYFK